MGEEHTEAPQLDALWQTHEREMQLTALHTTHTPASEEKKKKRRSS